VIPGLLSNKALRLLDKEGDNPSGLVEGLESCAIAIVCSNATKQNDTNALK